MRRRDCAGDGAPELGGQAASWAAARIRSAVAETASANVEAVIDGGSGGYDTTAGGYGTGNLGATGTNGGAGMPTATSPPSATTETTPITPGATAGTLADDFSTVPSGDLPDAHRGRAQACLLRSTSEELLGHPLALGVPASVRHLRTGFDCFDGGFRASVVCGVMSATL